MELNEILKEKGIDLDTAASPADLINQLDKLGSALETFISGKPEQNETQAKQPTSQNSTSSSKLVSDLSVKLASLENENQQLRDAAQKLLADFDKTNTDLRNALAKVKELEDQVAKLRQNQQDNTSVVRQNIALNKMVGAILSAIETAKREM